MDPTPSPDFVTALARGLEVLGCFGAQRRHMTLSQVAAHTKLSRGTARRFLLTLTQLGHLETDGKHFWMTPSVLGFANAYLSSFGVDDAVRAALRRLTDEVLESASMAVLDGGMITYIARADPPRRLASTVGLHIGSQLPAHCSSMGRVLLASLDPGELAAWMQRHPLTGLTEKTITDTEAWLAELTDVRKHGYAIVDGEMERGVRSLAIPVVGGASRKIAVNVATMTGRTSLAELRKTLLPALRRAAESIAPLLEHR